MKAYRMTKIGFKELELSKEVQSAIDDLGFEEATPIQSEAIPVLLQGKDLIGQSQTGTGKTAAFGIPAIELVDTHDKAVQVLILCPTRELAIQVAEEIKKLAKYKKGLSLIPIYGGTSYDRQLHALKRGVQIVIGTPGRITDHINRKTLDLSNVKMVVLDEADVMLDMGFRDDMEDILKFVPATRQTLLFSATMPKPILELTKKYQKDPVRIKVNHQDLTVPNVEQEYFEVRSREKIDALTNVIDAYNLKLVLVFANTKRMVDELVEHLETLGYDADALHGDMRQAAREKVLTKFRKGKIEILVATDVAARGIDVEKIEAVFNYDMPYDEESYVHRIGRTARAGQSGRAFSFVTGAELLRLRDIERYIKVKIKRSIVPSYKEVDQIRSNNLLDEIRKTIDAGNLEPYYEIIEKLAVDEYTTMDIAAALLKLRTSAANAERALKEKAQSEFGNRDRERSRDSDRRGGGRGFDKRSSDRGSDRKSDSRNSDRNPSERRFESKESGSRGRSSDRPSRSREDRDEPRRSSDEPMTKLFLNVGKKDQMRPGDILGAIAGETGISGKLVGDINMKDTFTYVDVPTDVADAVVSALDGITMRRKKIKVEIAG